MYQRLLKRVRISAWMQSSTILVLMLSFSSNVPLVLLGSTLQAWYTVQGVNIMAIGMLTLVGQPYIFKVLWAPLVDRYRLWGKHRRRAWIVFTQIALAIGFWGLSSMRPQASPKALAFFALILAFISATQDLGVDAARVDLTHHKNNHIIAVVTTLGERFGFLLAGAFALLIANYCGWQTMYRLMALVMAGCAIATCCFQTNAPICVAAPSSLGAAFIDPMKHLWHKAHIGWLIAFMLLYKIGDQFALALNTTFLIRGLGFSLAAIGVVYKLVSLLALLLGSVVGGFWMQRLGLYRSLWTFGVLQAAANLAYFVLAIIGKHLMGMVAAVFVEYFFCGMATVPFIAFVVGLCDSRYAAMQYAFFTAVMAIGRVYGGPEVAYLVNHLGWAHFFLLTAFMGLPALLILSLIRQRMTLTMFDLQRGV